MNFGIGSYVAFIPTVLYELYFIQQLAMYDSDVLKQAFQKTKYENRIPESRAFQVYEGYKEYRIDLPGHVFNVLTKWKLPNGGYDTAAIIREVYGVYQDANAPFFDTNNSLFLFFNTYLVNRFFEFYPEFTTSPTVEGLSDGIQRKAKDFLMRCKPPQVKDIKGGYLSPKAASILRDVIEKKEEQTVIERVMDIEYEARSINKGLMFRVTELVQMQLKSDAATYNTKYRKNLGSTLTEKSKPVEQCRDETFCPYSCSFGVTLFAGIFYDRNASVMFLLKDISHSVVYAILIDKQAYVKNNVDDLFFIPPISPFAGILQQGEFFHARAKAASKGKETPSGFSPSGAGVSDDPVGFFITKRNPLRHAELFSNYLAKHARIIRVSDSDMEKLGVDNEKEFMRVINENQLEAASFYGGVCAMKSALDKAPQRLRAKKIPAPSQQSTSWGQWVNSWINWMRGNPQ